MTNHTLFVCRACSAEFDHEEVTDKTPTEGLQLLEQLQNLPQLQIADSKLNIQSVGCLWTCSRPCSVSFTCTGKYTYHFVDLHPVDSVNELQQFSELYIKSSDGYVKPPHMPGELRSRLLVRIPPTLEP
jgi:predicted metal-binding protein